MTKKGKKSISGKTLVLTMSCFGIISFNSMHK
jgi:hypothetical protein